MPDGSSTSFAVDSEALRVECRLLHNECETEGSALFRSNGANVRSGRIMAAVGFVLLASTAPFAYWQMSSLHRVWRIRHPKKVTQHQRIIAFNCVFGLGTLVYLAGPFGYVERGRHTIERMEALDKVAWSAALLEHRISAGTVSREEALQEWAQLQSKRSELFG
jgi:hypothetical protein